MCHAALEQSCTLYVGFSRTDVGQSATIPGTYQKSKLGHIYHTPGHPVVDISVIELPFDASSWAPRASIPYLWIFEGASKEEVGFQPGTSCHEQKQDPAV